MTVKKYFLLLIVGSIFWMNIDAAVNSDDELIFNLEIASENEDETSVSSPDEKFPPSTLRLQASLLIWFAVKSGDKILFDRCLGFKDLQFNGICYEKGGTLLHHVARIKELVEEKRLYFMKRLLNRKEFKDSINMLDNEGDTALNIATKEKLKKIALVLIKNGANLSTKKERNRAGSI